MSSPTHSVRFGPFELDLHAAELHHNSTKAKLPEQPFQILCELVEHAGEVVTRDQLRQRLWRSDTFVDFEHGLNTAVKRLREILGDSAEDPLYIETLPRHGYRLIVPVEKAELAPHTLSTDSLRHRKIRLAVSVLLLAIVAAGVVWWLWERSRPVKIESLAVLPLENLSGNPEEEYFADGMTEALITELGKVHALRVISRHSVMHYKGTNQTVPQIARELHVDAVVEGSAMRTGYKVRITAQLIQTNPERHLWSGSYEHNLSDLIALQQEVTRTIVREIRVSLTPVEEQRLTQFHPVSPEAYEAYIKGRYFLAKAPEGVRRSADFFQEAISKDPDYAGAYVGLAYAYYIMGVRSILPFDQAYPKIPPLMTKALALDDSLSDAHNLFAGMLETQWEWTGAEREYQRALELDPSNAQAHHWYGWFLVEMGRIEEGLAENQRARQLDPTDRSIDSGFAIKLIFAKRYDEAIRQAKASVEMDENSAPAHFALGYAYTEKGMPEEAIAELKRVSAVTEGSSYYLGALAYSYSVFGRKAEACGVVKELQGLTSRGTWVKPIDWATASTACGQNNAAIYWLERAYREHDPSLVFLKVDLMFDKLRPDPRFQDLLRRMNFPQ